jgi:structural maintenance of chromosome 4
MLEAALSKMKPNMGTIEEYRRKEGEYSNRVKELDEITQSRDAQRRQFESLRKQRFVDSVICPLPLSRSKVHHCFLAVWMSS